MQSDMCYLYYICRKRSVYVAFSSINHRRVTAIHSCQSQVYLNSLEVPLHQLQPPPGGNKPTTFPSLSDTPFTFVDTPELLAGMMEEIKGEREIAVSAC